MTCKLIRLDKYLGETCKINKWMILRQANWNNVTKVTHIIVRYVELIGCINNISSLRI